MIINLATSEHLQISCRVHISVAFTVLFCGFSMQADARTTCSCVCWGLHCCESGQQIEDRVNKHPLAWYEERERKE